MNQDLKPTNPQTAGEAGSPSMVRLPALGFGPAGDVTTPHTLTTARLVLRTLRPGDAADVFAFRSDPVVQRFNAEPMKNPAEAVPFLAELGELQSKGVAVHWGITIAPEDRVVGTVSLAGIDRFHRRAGVGYDLAHTCWGKGLGREAVGAVLKYAFDILGLHRVDAHTVADNHESTRLLKPLDFVLEATLRDFSLEDDGAFHNSTIWSLLDHEFASRQQQQGR